MSAATIAARLRLTDDYGVSPLGFVIAMLSGIVALVLVIGVAATLGMRAYGRTACRQFGTQTGFPTKFVLIGWADAGTCLAQAPDGRWVLNTKVMQFVGSKP